MENFDKNDFLLIKLIEWVDKQKPLSENSTQDVFATTLAGLCYDMKEDRFKSNVLDGAYQKYLNRETEKSTKQKYLKKATKELTKKEWLIKKYSVSIMTRISEHNTGKKPFAPKKTNEEGNPSKNELVKMVIELLGYDSYTDFFDKESDAFANITFEYGNQMLQKAGCKVQKKREDESSFIKNNHPKNDHNAIFSDDQKKLLNNLAGIYISYGVGKENTNVSRMVFEFDELGNGRYRYLQKLEISGTVKVLYFLNDQTLCIALYTKLGLFIIDFLRVDRIINNKVNSLFGGFLAISYTRDIILGKCFFKRTQEEFDNVDIEPISLENFVMNPENKDIFNSISIDRDVKLLNVSIKKESVEKIMPFSGTYILLRIGSKRNTIVYYLLKIRQDTSCIIRGEADDYKGFVDIFKNYMVINIIKKKNKNETEYQNFYSQFLWNTKEKSTIENIREPEQVMYTGIDGDANPICHRWLLMPLKYEFSEDIKDKNIRGKYNNINEYVIFCQELNKNFLETIYFDILKNKYLLDNHLIYHKLDDYKKNEIDQTIENELHLIRKSINIPKIEGIFNYIFNSNSYLLVEEIFTKKSHLIKSFNLFSTACYLSFRNKNQKDVLEVLQKAFENGFGNTEEEKKTLSDELKEGGVLKRYANYIKELRFYPL